MQPRSKVGINNFKQAETEWKGVYKDEKLMEILSSGWEGWLEKKGMGMMVEEDLEKILHSVMAMWTDQDDAKNRGVQKKNDNESENCPSANEGEEEEGYSSGMDLRKLLSRRWSRDVRKKSNKGNGTPDDDRGGKSEDEEVSGVREMESEREGNLGRRGMTVLAVLMLVQQKAQG